MPVYLEWLAQEVLDLLNHARTTWVGQEALAPVVPLAEKQLPASLPSQPAGAIS